MKHTLIVSSFLALGFLMSLGLPLQAQTQDANENLSQLTQKPVAVDKLVEATGNPDVVQNLARSLNDGNVDASNFNQTLSGAAQTGNIEGITNVGTFVREQVKNGFRGKELAESIHQHLNKLGIPAGGNSSKGPPPIAQQFIPEKAQGQLRNNRQKNRSRPTTSQQRGSSNRPSSAGGSSGRSGSAGKKGGRR